ncbi:MAG TPA: hypothetical protein VJ577_14040 [Burkholderiaceae bacterium]|nr:hypothetical protein [Burkholderiaceae bacterium]
MIETRVSHRDDSNGLFIGASKLLLTLMNSAPAELLHLLAYAALQPSLTISLQEIANTGFSVCEVHPNLRNQCNGDSRLDLAVIAQKCRQQRQHWNTISEMPIYFSKKTPPCPIKSDAAAQADEIDPVFYCSLTLIIAFLCLQSLFSDLIDCDLPDSTASDSYHWVILHISNQGFSACLVFDYTCREKVALFFSNRPFQHLEGRTSFMRKF